jgi:hypothetical protein
MTNTFFSAEPSGAGPSLLEPPNHTAKAGSAASKIHIACIEPAQPPPRLQKLDDAEIKTIGFSRQKTSYGRRLAHAILDGQLDLAALEHLPDETIRKTLTDRKGIGVWSATGFWRSDSWKSTSLRAMICARKSASGVRPRWALTTPTAFWSKAARSEARVRRGGPRSTIIR